MFKGFLGELFDKKEGLPKFFVVRELEQGNNPNFKFEIFDDKNVSLGKAVSEIDAVFLVERIFKEKGVDISLKKDGEKYVPVFKV